MSSKAEHDQLPIVTLTGFGGNRMLEYNLVGGFLYCENL